MPLAEGIKDCICVAGVEGITVIIVGLNTNGGVKIAKEIFKR